MPNPADRAARYEDLLREVFWRRYGRRRPDEGLFGALRGIPEAAIRQAIRQGSIAPMTDTATWRNAVVLASRRASEIETRLAAFGLRSGLSEVPATKLGPTVGALSEEIGSERAVRLIQAIDSRTRQTISGLIKSASAEYSRQPSLGTLRGLANDIRPLIGLTPKQAAQLRRKWRALRKAGVSRDGIRKIIDAAAQKMIGRRAEAIADRGVIEAVSEARHRAWLEARAAGEISEDAMKAWRDQGDERVRHTHRLQTEQGPIPLDEVYPVFGVQHPPAPEFGCRCWEVLVNNK